MTTAAQWHVIMVKMAAAVREDPAYIGVLSVGEACAVALILDRPELRPEGYTWIDCVARIEIELLQACITAQRHFREEG